MIRMIGCPIFHVVGTLISLAKFFETIVKAHYIPKFDPVSDETGG